MNGLQKLTSIVISLLVSVVSVYVLFLVVSKLLGLPDWETVSNYFPNTIAFAVVAIFFLLAVYGAWSRRGVAVIFTIVGGLLILTAFIGIVFLGQEGAARFYNGLKNNANEWTVEVLENGINFGSETPEGPAPIAGPIRLDGGILPLRPDEEKHIVLTGEILILVPESGYCINRNPAEGTRVRWNQSANKVWIGPIGESAELIVRKHKSC